jgi:tetratricopeptide (TPR) repeat protein
VPYGKVWRAGANENTTIEFSDPVKIEGKPLPNGTYGLHMIPGVSEWTVIFSKNSSSWGSFTYNAAEDALRVTVTPQSSEFHEALSYEFDGLKDDSTLVTLRWEKLAVPFKVDANVNEVAQQSFKKQLRGAPKYTWEGWYEASDYLLNKKLELKDALEYADQSIKQEERFDTLMLKARVLEAMGRNDDASPLRDKALAMANALQLNSYGRTLQRNGQQDKAFEIFRLNGKRNPDHFIVHYEVARMAVAQGDFDNAVKEMKVALAGSPADFKPFFEGLLIRLEAKEDINK